MAAENKVNNLKEGLASAQRQKEETKQQIDDLQEQLKAMQAEHDAQLKNLQTEGRAETDIRLQRAKDEINAQLARTIDSSMSEMSNRYSDQATDQIKTKQTDVLRMNKIFRDVARALGMNWKSVYETLTLDFPVQVTDNELRIIEAQSPVMQAYKALNSWKQLAGQNCSMAKLADALRQCSFPDVADMVEDTMAKEGDCLMSLKNVGQGKGPGMLRQSSLESAGDGASKEAGAAPAKLPTHINLLDDKNLLKIARALGGNWMELGRALMFPDDELQEVLQNEGMTYQGAFKILWGWRDKNENAMHQDNVTVLKEALQKINRQDVIEKWES